MYSRFITGMQEFLSSSTWLPNFILLFILIPRNFISLTLSSFLLSISFMCIWVPKFMFFVLLMLIFNPHFLHHLLISATNNFNMSGCLLIKLAHAARSSENWDSLHLFGCWDIAHKQSK